MANVKKTATNLIVKADEETYGKLETTASRVRFLLAKGHSRGDIARFLNIRYQWVNNVMNQPLKKS